LAGGKGGTQDLKGFRFLRERLARKTRGGEDLALFFAACRDRTGGEREGRDTVHVRPSAGGKRGREPFTFSKRRFQVRRGKRKREVKDTPLLALRSNRPREEGRGEIFFSHVAQGEKEGRKEEPSYVGVAQDGGGGKKKEKGR